MIAAPQRRPRVVYPTSDGKPVAETELHFREIFAMVQMLDRIFDGRSDAYVAGNNFLYYEEGNPSACFSPDVYVVFGVSKKVRDTFKVWKEGGHVPSFVLELTSKSTKDEDLGDKKRKCERLKVREYFMFDPRGDYLVPSLRGFRLKGSAYAEIEPDELGRLFSDVLNHKLDVCDVTHLGLYDSITGVRLPRLEELAQREADARRAAEEENERLKAELKRLKKN
jgi:Uma2 family endonuclease